LFGKHNFFIGVFDILPIEKIFHVLTSYLPSILTRKLQKFVLSDYKKLRSHISWNFFKSKLQNINPEKLESCAQDLEYLLENVTPDTSHVKIFHLGTKKIYSCKL